MRPKYGYHSQKKYNLMKRFFLTLLLALSSLGLCHAETTKVLIIGSVHDLGDKYGSDSAAFSPTAIASELDSILSQNGPGNATVTVAERHNNNLPTGFVYNTATFLSDSYNLTGWFHYPLPAGAEDARWANLRGESGTVWDYVVIIGDPYTMEKTPGMYAQGVAKVAEEVAKGADPAEVILLMNWPAGTSSSSVAHYQEVVYRAGRSGGYMVAPAALAWQAAGSPTAGGGHPNADGAYIAAASIYSRIYNQSASNSGYTYNDTLAGTVQTTVAANVGQPQYSGDFNFVNPYLMLGDTRRDVHFSEKGSSTEEDFKNAAKAAMDRSGVSYNTIDYCPDGSSSSASYNSNTPEDDGLGWPTGNSMPIAWNHGRSYPDGKKWVLNTNYWQLGFGYEYQWNTTAYSDEIANDHYIAMMDYYDTNRANQMLSDAAAGARWLPTRMLWAQMHQEYPALDPMRDSNHLNWDQTHAVGSYMYTLYSGRCPLDPEPSPMTSRWMAQKIGYETAWRMGRCQTRAPGFKVMPSAASAKGVTPTSSDTMTVQFIMAPTHDVTVAITTDDRLTGKVSPSQLTFTPANYNVPQTVTVIGETGGAGGFEFDAQFSTTSTDPVYDGLSDAWAYTNTRPEGPVPPDIQILGNGLPIESGDTTADVADGTDFGGSASPVTRVFTIKNLSDSNTLNLTGSPRVTLTSGSGNFTLTQDAATASIAPLGSTTFEITYDAAGGMHTAQVSVASSDANLPTYTFDIVGFSPGVPTVINQGATGGQLSATLEGQLSDGGTADATIYWGTTDGGTTPGNWDNVVPIAAVTQGNNFSAELTGLVAGRQYFYRSYVTNSEGSDWADSTVPFMTAVPPALPLTMVRWGAPGGEDIVTANGDSGTVGNYVPATPRSLALGTQGYYLTDSANRTPVFYGAHTGTLEFRQNGTTDYAQFAKYMSVGETTKAMLVWKKADFLADRSVTVTRFKLNLSGPTDLSYDNHWVVEKAGQFYISDQTFSPGNLDVDASTLTWREYTPMNVDTIGAAATITLYDLDSVGFYINGLRDADTEGVWMRPSFNYFAVDGDEDPDLSATVNYVSYVAGSNGSITAGTAIQEVLYDGSTTAVTVTPSAGYEFINWSDGSTANPRTDANVTSSQNYTANFAEIVMPVVVNQGATGGQLGATLGGQLTQGASADAWIYWGDNDGGTTPGNWDNAESIGSVSEGINFSTMLTGLVGGRQYYYRCYTSNANGSDWADSTVPFTTAAPPALPLTMVRFGAPGGEDIITANTGAGTPLNTYNPATPISLALGTQGHYITDSANRTPVFYGAGNLGAIDYRQNGTTDHVWLAKYMNFGDTMKAMLVWKKADFLADRSVTVTRFKLELSDPADLTYENRWVVEKAGQFYISDQTYTTGNLDVDASTLTWRDYTPLNGGTDTIGAAATITLYDLDSVGFYVNAERTGGGSGWLRPTLKYFAVDGDEDPDLSATVNYVTYAAGPNGSITGATTQEVLYDGSTTEVTATPNANYAFVDWSDGSTANPRSDTNVTSSQTYTANFTAAVTGVNAVPHAWLTAQDPSWTSGFDALQATDHDGDGVTTGDEYWAGTDPKNKDSVLALAISLENGVLTLEWNQHNPAAELPDLRLESCTDLRSTPWDSVEEMPRTHGVMIWQRPVGADAHGFYRIVAPEKP
jgi:hypothetical protein